MQMGTSCHHVGVSDSYGACARLPLLIPSPVVRLRCRTSQDVEPPTPPAVTCDQTALLLWTEVYGRVGNERMIDLDQATQNAPTCQTYDYVC